MADFITVGMGELKTGGQGDTLAAYGIGSCVVVVCYDRDKPLAGMLHGMLPEKTGKKPDSNRYLDSGIENLVKALLEAGSGISAMEAKIFGGARMFDVKQEGESIGDRNARKAKEILEKKGIKITGQDTGSTYGRNIEYSVNDRKAIVRSFMSGTKTL
jgi:chemotaxis protein CheD